MQAESATADAHIHTYIIKHTDATTQCKLGCKPCSYESKVINTANETEQTKVLRLLASAFQTEIVDLKAWEVVDPMVAHTHLQARRHIFFLSALARSRRLQLLVS